MDAPPQGLWDAQAELVALAGGHRNRAFRTVGLVPDRVFKSTRRSPAALDWLSAVHECAEASGFAVPRLVPSVNGCLVEGGWTCEAFIPGRALASHEMSSIRSSLEAFHAATRCLPQRPGFLAASDLVEAPTGGDVDLASMPAALVSACRAAWTRLAGMERCAVHGDVNPSNLIRCDDGRTALIDWDEARVDVPLFDLAGLAGAEPEAAEAVLAWEVACCWRLEPRRASRLAARMGLGRRSSTTDGGA